MRRLVRWWTIAFLVAHGLVHVAIWAPTHDPAKVPFDPAHSWLIGDRRGLARFLAFLAAAMLITAGIALWAEGEWWRPMAVAGLGVSTFTLLVYFNVWYLFILAVNIGLIVGIAWQDWPSKAAVGA